MEAAAKYTQQTYRIAPRDSLSMRHTFHPEMNQKEFVRPDGKISALLVGYVSVTGMTTADHGFNTFARPRFPGY